MIQPLQPAQEQASVIRLAGGARMTAQVSEPRPLPSPALHLLLELETKIRATSSVSELQVLVANEAVFLGQGCRVLIFAQGRLGKLRLAATSHTGRFDGHAPAVTAYEKMVEAKLDIIEEIPEEAQALIGPFAITEEGQPLPLHGVILPLKRGHRLIGALFLVGTFPWRDAALKLLVRLADTTAHAWAFHEPGQRWTMTRRNRWLAGLLIVCVLGILSLVPVPLTALAPARVVTTDPTIIAAPIDGVIEDVLVNPNDRVVAGAPLLRFVEIALAAKAEAAEREMLVAEARFKRVSLVALSNLDAKRELAIVEAEFALKRTERDFAADQLRRSRVTAPVAGIALFGDRRDWASRPVTTGERIMELGDPARIELQLELPIEDAIAMVPGQRVSAFLDSAPLSPVSAEVTRINHEPRVIEGRGLAFVIHARITDDQKPQLGVRGTAHIRGEPVALGLFLFRRPISSFRQWAGV
ncbi:MAG: HlyD family efflux transporter periplasmic adaptor subunit [Beijerinckiaceae bacterium]